MRPEFKLLGTGVRCFSPIACNPYMTVTAHCFTPAAADVLQVLKSTSLAGCAGQLPTLLPSLPDAPCTLLLTMLPVPAAVALSTSIALMAFDVLCSQPWARAVRSHPYRRRLFDTTSSNTGSPTPPGCYYGSYGENSPGGYYGCSDQVRRGRGL